MSTVSSIGTLPQKVAQIAKRCSSLVAAKWYATTNAIHEVLTGAAAPGAQTVLLYPHDHSGAAHRLGIPLARNNVYSYDGGDIDGDPGWVVGFATAYSDFYRMDRDGTTVADQTAGNANIMACASPGIDTDETAESGSDAAWTAKVLIYPYYPTSGSSDTYAYFRNKTTGSVSSTQTTSTLNGLAWLTFDDIPVKGTTWNELDLLFAVDDEDSGNAAVYVLNVTITETRDASQRASDGVADYVTITKP